MSGPYSNQGTSTGTPLTATIFLVGVFGLAPTPTCANIPESTQVQSYAGSTSIPEPTPGEMVHPSTPAEEMTTQECIQEIRTISGVTWKEISTIFGVSMRAVHQWAEGDNLSKENAATLRDVLTKIRKIHPGSASATGYRLRSRFQGKPLLETIKILSIDEVPLTPVPEHVTRPSRTDGKRLMANWDPTPPFRGRWDVEPSVEEIKPVGEYPIWLPKVPPLEPG